MPKKETVPKRAKCSNCGILPVGYVKHFNRRPYCMTCLTRYFAQCCVCDDWCERNYRGPDNGWICSSHLNKSYTECRGCRSWQPAEVWGKPFPEMRCPKCYDVKGDFLDMPRRSKWESVCVSAWPDFTIETRLGLITNDTPFTFQHEGTGDIGQPGKDKIRDALWDFGHNTEVGRYNEERVWTENNILEDIEWTSDTSRGSLSKRVAKWYATHYPGAKLNQKLLGQIGDYAAQYSDKSETLRVMLTRNINRHPNYFCNGGNDFNAVSCWWGDAAFKEESRCLFKSYGGIALLTLDPNDRPLSRAWLQPLDEICIAGQYSNDPTRYTKTSRWMVYNGYSSPKGRAKDTLPMTRLWANITGLNYDRVQLSQSQDGCYINTNGNGHTMSYLVAKEITNNDKRVHWQWDRKCNCNIKGAADYEESATTRQEAIAIREERNKPKSRAKVYTDPYRGPSSSLTYSRTVTYNPNTQAYSITED